MSTVALRTSLVWHDEVMHDVVLDKPATITLGATGKPTFVIPELGLPNSFAIMRPGNRGYLLTLGEKMGGTICIDGKQQDVAEFVRKGGDADSRGGFRATPISGRDWGVIELDDSGVHKLFFQFVPVEDAQPFFTKPVLLATLGGYLLSIVVLSALFAWKGIRVDWTLLDSERLAQTAEATFRAWAMSTAALGVSAVFWWIFRQDGESQASLAFSVMLHAALLFMTYQLYDGTNPFVWPGPRSNVGQYLVTRLEPEKPPEPQKPSVGVKKDQGEAAAKTPDPPKKIATKGNEGKAGGEGDTERARKKNAKDDDKPPPPKVAMMEDKNVTKIDAVMNRNMDFGKFEGVNDDFDKKGSSGFGKGKGVGVGTGTGWGTRSDSKGKGNGGGGNAHGDFVSSGKPIAMEERSGGGKCAHPPCGTAPKPATITMDNPSGDFEGLTAEEINRVVNAARSRLRACYQHEFNRNPNLAGKLVVQFVIDGSGGVKSSRTASGSSLRDSEVEGCVNRTIMGLKFPAKGGISNVRYPFGFTPGGG